MGWGDENARRVEIQRQADIQDKAIGKSVGGSGGLMVAVIIFFLILSYPLYGILALIAWIGCKVIAAKAPNFVALFWIVVIIFIVLAFMR